MWSFHCFRRICAVGLQVVVVSDSEHLASTFSAAVLEEDCGICANLLTKSRKVGQIASDGMAAFSYRRS